MSERIWFLTVSKAFSIGFGSGHEDHDCGDDERRQGHNHESPAGGVVHRGDRRAQEQRDSDQDEPDQRQNASAGVKPIRMARDEDTFLASSAINAA